MRTVLIVLAIFFAGLDVSAQDLPLEEVRSPQSGASAVYFPSLGLGASGSVLPFHDNFSVAGYAHDLIPEGPNLNLDFGFSHDIQDSLVIPASGEAVDSFLFNRDKAWLSSVYSFLHFYKFEAELDYDKNQPVDFGDAALDDYSYQRFTGRLGLAYDRRRSSHEAWTSGLPPTYPESGFVAGFGARGNLSTNLLTETTTPSLSAYARFQALAPLGRWLTLSMEGYGESLLTKPVSRASDLSTEVVGAYQIGGDYVADADLELRFAWPTGLYFESPPILLINSFLFKLSPGLILGYDGGLAGSLGAAPDMLQAFYVSPLVSVRVEGSLVAFLRCDLSVANSNYSRLVFAIGIGDVNAKSSPLWRRK